MPKGLKQLSLKKKAKRQINIGRKKKSLMLMQNQLDQQLQRMEVRIKYVKSLIQVTSQEVEVEEEEAVEVAVEVVKEVMPLKTEMMIEELEAVEVEVKVPEVEETVKEVEEDEEMVKEVVEDEEMVKEVAEEEEMVREVVEEEETVREVVEEEETVREVDTEEEEKISTLIPGNGNIKMKNAHNTNTTKISKWMKTQKLIHIPKKMQSSNYQTRITTDLRWTNWIKELKNVNLVSVMELQRKSKFSWVARLEVNQRLSEMKLLKISLKSRVLEMKRKQSLTN